MREVTPKSISLLSKPAQNLTRTYSLDPDEAGNEFYKLALDCGLTPAYANDVRQAVRKSGKAQAKGARR